MAVPQTRTALRINILAAADPVIYVASTNPDVEALRQTAVSALNTANVVISALPASSPAEINPYVRPLTCTHVHVNTHVNVQAKIFVFV